MVLGLGAMAGRGQVGDKAGGLVLGVRMGLGEMGQDWRLKLGGRVWGTMLGGGRMRLESGAGLGGGAGGSPLGRGTGTGMAGHPGDPSGPPCLAGRRGRQHPPPAAPAQNQARYPPTPYPPSIHPPSTPLPSSAPIPLSAQASPCCWPETPPTRSCPGAPAPPPRTRTSPPTPCSRGGGRQPLGGVICMAPRPPVLCPLGAPSPHITAPPTHPQHWGCSCSPPPKPLVCTPISSFGGELVPPPPTSLVSARGGGTDTPPHLPSATPQSDRAAVK